MSNKKSVTYGLKTPVTVTVAGKFVDAQSIEMFAPVASMMKNINILDSEFHKAKANSDKAILETIKGITPEQIETFKKGISEDKVPEPTPLAVVSDMVKNGADMDKCITALKDLLTVQVNAKPMCIIDTVPLIKEHFDNLSIIDTKEILGLYLISFLGISRSM